MRGQCAAERRGDSDVKGETIRKRKAGRSFCESPLKAIAKDGAIRTEIVFKIALKGKSESPVNIVFRH